MLYSRSLAKVYEFDTRHESIIQRPDTAVACMNYNSDEINQIAIHPSGKHMAVCDDSGEIMVVDLSNHALHRRLRKHTNVCVHVRVESIS
jgi:tricorn protease-like protein